MNKETFRPFSVRYKRALAEKKFRPSLSKKLRSRIWYILQEYDIRVLTHPYPASNWNEESTILAELPQKLLKVYGVDKLEAFVDDSGTRKKVDLKGFVSGAYPAQVLDVVEIMYIDSPSESQPSFQREINQVMRDESCPWVLCDGQFVQMDSKFFEDEILAKANELLAVDQFQGAKQEFIEARNDFSVGDYKGTIHNACKAFESVMKVIENRPDGSAKELIKGLEEIGFYKDLPESIINSFGNEILMALPYLRNRLGGHGQGSEVIEVPKQLAKLALHLAGSFIVFLIEHYLEVIGQPASLEEDTEDKNSDIPF